jgi:hypothetical protein
MDLRPFVVVAGVAAAAWLQGPAGENNAQRRRTDFRYTPDPRVIRVAAGAHRSTTADLIWLRTLPDMSREFSDVEHKARWIDNALTSITDLEPTFGTVYDFGQAYLTLLDKRIGGNAERAIALLEKGVRAMPGSAGLRVRLAMIWYLERKDREKTVEILLEASKLADFDTLSASMLSALLAGKREDIVALGNWAELMESGSPEVKRIAERNLWATKAEIARRAAREFEQKNGRRPAAPDDIANATYVQAEVVPLVREGLEIDSGGVPRYPRGQELELEANAQQATVWCRTFRDERGRWPTVEEIHDILRLPRAPAGRKWQVVDGVVSLVPDAR